MSAGRHRGIWARFDPGFAVVILVCLVAIWPFVSRPGLPQATDAELHVFRLAELSRLVRAGEWYPRWAPNFYYGYGYPIFNFYAPLSYYAGLTVDLLPKLGPVEGVKAVFVASLLVGGVGLYGFARDNWGRLAGLVAAAAYVYAPYIQFVDPHARGDLAESTSFGLFPLALWALDRLRRRPSAGALPASSLLLAAVILSHNLLGIIFFGLLVFWAAWHSLIGSTGNIGGLGGVATALGKGVDQLRFRDRLTLRRLVVGAIRLRIALALLLAIGLSAFFWLTVALEKDTVRLDNLVGEGSNFDFRNHFLDVRELLSGPGLIDWGATEPDFTFSLGLAQWLLGAAGLVALACPRGKAKRQAGFATISLVAMVFLMVPQSAFIWERVPYLPFLQFPWRLLGAVASMLAILAGYGASVLLAHANSALRPWLAAGLIGGIVIAALPLSQVPPWPADFGSTSVQRVLELELAGRWLGTTSTGDFVPATVDVLPRANESLVQDLLNGRPPDRVNRATLPSGTTVVSEILGPLRMRFHVSGTDYFLLRLFLFDFPGWHVRLDGTSVKTELGLPEGFMVVPVEAGSHVVDVRFGTTPARRAAAWVSVVSLAITFLLAGLFLALRRSDLATEGSAHSVETLSLLPPVGILSVIVAFHLLLLEPGGILRLESSNFRAMPAEKSVFANFGDQVALIGYDANDLELSPGEELRVSLYWKAIQPLAINYQVFVHLTDPDLTVVAQSDKLNPGDYPTKSWPTDKYVRDEHRLRIPNELANGRYQLSTGLWVAKEGWRLPLLDEKGSLVGDHFIFPEAIMVGLER